MRTIRFRGKRVDNGEWIEGDLMQKYIHHQGCLTIVRDGCIYYKVIPETLGQFTGLHDKNGKEIFEGDIVKWDDNSNGKYWRICAISWEKSHYKLNGYTFDSKTPEVKRPVDFKFGQFIYEYDGVLKVIGNIIDNPELL